MMIKSFALFALVAISAAFIVPEDQYQEYMIVGHYEPDEHELVDLDQYVRHRRSFAPGGTQIGGSTESPYPWSVGGKVDRVGQDTVAKINAGHKTDQTQITGTWNKVVRGPHKSKPNWSVGAHHRWTFRKNEMTVKFMMMIKCIVLFALVAISTAFIIPEDQYQEYIIVGHYEPHELVDLDQQARHRRSFAPGGTQIGGSTESPYPWSVGGNVDRVGQDTVAKINAGHKTDQTQITGTWSKVVRGPHKSKPNWSIGAQHRW
ncbi:acaloleptin A-like [Onthophagus taurus]|uniref:acaloleptin A-like n=1 Tax=Onthophagus taurus TaxID=166361 RepID=UPI0039BDBB36